MQIGSCFALAAVAAASLSAGAMTDSADGAAGACPKGTTRAVVAGKAKCLRSGQTCKARYEAAYERHGFTCVKGRLRRRPAPAPPARTGHYHGTTSQNEVIDFDVTADGRTVTNAATGQINQGCTPPLHLAGGGLRGASAPVSAAGSFVIDFDYDSTVSGVPSKGHFNVTGRFNGPKASGTITVTTNFTSGGTAYSCGSGQQTWTASRTG